MLPLPDLYRSSTSVVVRAVPSQTTTSSMRPSKSPHTSESGREMPKVNGEPSLLAIVPS